jgi:hypothetical protein
MPGDRRILAHVLALGVFGYLALLSLGRPLSDPDLFWHLKQGQWMLQHRAFMTEDPFAYTSPRPLSEAQQRGLRSQWLGQVLLYGTYAVGGYPGLVLLRTLLLVGPFLLLYVLFAARRAPPELGEDPWWPLAVLAVLALPLFLLVSSSFYTFERPQALSFLLALALVALLGSQGGPLGRRVFLIPPLMALWSNLHGGYVFGVVLLGAFALGWALQCILRGAFSALWRPLLGVALGLLASGLNPNGFALAWGVLWQWGGRFLPLRDGSGAPYDIGEVLEYRPLLSFMAEFRYFWVPFMVAFMVVVALLVLAKYAYRGRPEPPEAFMVAAFLALGFSMARGVSFALLGLPLFALRALRWQHRLMRAFWAGLLVVLLVWIGVLWQQRAPGDLRIKRPSMGVNTLYPEAAVQFILQEGIEGPMFNELRWGGYLIWRLWPQERVFIDGRLIEPAVVDAYLRVLRARPGWQELLRALGVNFLLIQTISRENGLVAPLVVRLLEQGLRDWKLLYLRGNVALFVRAKGPNQLLADTRSVPGQVLAAALLQEVEDMLRVFPGHANALLSRAVALYWLGRHQEAKDLLQRLPPSGLRDRYLRLLQGG